MATFSRDGVDLDYSDTGSGAPVLFVHGHPFDRSMWRPQADHVAAGGWRAIVPDLRGYGASTVVPGVTMLDDFATDLAGLLDHLGLARAVLAGLSMGGQIVLAFHRLFPDRVAGVVLADTFATTDPPAARTARNVTADRLVRDGMAGYADEVLAKMIAPATITRQPEVAAHVAGMMRGAPPAGAAAALRGRALRPDYTDVLGQIRVPAVVLVGADDEFTPVSDATYLADRIAGARLVVLAGAAHLPNLERPAEFNAALTRFLGTVPN
jgi:pimeloyl-ACP methyl ester carboxylesterase